MSQEETKLKDITEEFLKKLKLTAKYTIDTRYHEDNGNKIFVIRFQEFSGSYGHQFMFNAHMAVKHTGLNIEVDWHGDE